MELLVIVIVICITIIWCVYIILKALPDVIKATGDQTQAHCNRQHVYSPHSSPEETTPSTDGDHMTESEHVASCDSVGGSRSSLYALQDIQENLVAEENINLELDQAAAVLVEHIPDMFKETGSTLEDGPDGVEQFEKQVENRGPQLIVRNDEQPPTQNAMDTNSSTSIGNKGYDEASIMDDGFASSTSFSAHQDQIHTPVTNAHVHVLPDGLPFMEYHESVQKTIDEATNGIFPDIEESAESTIPSTTVSTDSVEIVHSSPSGGSTVDIKIKGASQIFTQIGSHNEQLINSIDEGYYSYVHLDTGHAAAVTAIPGPSTDDQYHDILLDSGPANAIPGSSTDAQHCNGQLLVSSPANAMGAPSTGYQGYDGQLFDSSPANAMGPPSADDQNYDDQLLDSSPANVMGQPSTGDQGYDGQLLDSSHINAMGPPYTDAQHYDGQLLDSNHVNAMGPPSTDAKHYDGQLLDSSPANAMGPPSTGDQGYDGQLLDSSPANAMGPPSTDAQHYDGQLLDSSPANAMDPPSTDYQGYDGQLLDSSRANVIGAPSTDDQGYDGQLLDSSPANVMGPLSTGDQGYDGQLLDSSPANAKGPPSGGDQGYDGPLLDSCPANAMGPPSPDDPGYDDQLLDSSPANAMGPPSTGDQGYDGHLLDSSPANAMGAPSTGDQSYDGQLLDYSPANAMGPPYTDYQGYDGQLLDSSPANAMGPSSTDGQGYDGQLLDSSPANAMGPLSTGDQGYAGQLLYSSPANAMGPPSTDDQGYYSQPFDSSPANAMCPPSKDDQGYYSKPFDSSPTNTMGAPSTDDQGYDRKLLDSSPANAMGAPSRDDQRYDGPLLASGVNVIAGLTTDACNNNCTTSTIDTTQVAEEHLFLKDMDISIQFGGSITQLVTSKCASTEKLHQSSNRAQTVTNTKGTTSVCHSYRDSNYRIAFHCDGRCCVYCQVGECNSLAIPSKVKLWECTHVSDTGTSDWRLTIYSPATPEGEEILPDYHLCLYMRIYHLPVTTSDINSTLSIPEGIIKALENRFQAHGLQLFSVKPDSGAYMFTFRVDEVSKPINDIKGILDFVKSSYIQFTGQNIHLDDVRCSFWISGRDVNEKRYITTL